MFKRDLERLTDCRRRMNVMPLGSGALAGTTYPLDREFVANELGFDAITMNSLDGVSDRDFVLETMKRSGKLTAQAVQEKSANMTGTELNAEDMYIPDFKAAIKKMNMLERNVGFVCKSSAGRVVKLLQKYDSSIYTQEPEELPAQFGFVWSNDPAKAKPFIASATSPYMKNNCCIEPTDGLVYASEIDNNVHSPVAYPQGWKAI